MQSGIFLAFMLARQFDTPLFRGAGMGRGAKYWRDQHATQQDKVRFWLQFGLMIVLTALFLLIFWAASWWTNDSVTASGLVGVKDRVDFLNKGLEYRGKSIGYEGYQVNDLGVFLIAAAFTGLTLWLANGSLAKRWAARYFPSYNPVGFEPIPATVSSIGADRVLPWAVGSAMDAIFHELRARLSDPAETGTDRVPFLSPRAKPETPLPFDYFLLLGRPGAGKSRLAEHLARQLGCRGVLGDRGKGAPANPKAAQTLGDGEARRRYFWWRERQRSDPWDSGRIDCAPPQALAQWQPARPTILWMDDPLASDAKRWLDALREYAATWRFPVRLIIANQTRLHEVPDPANEKNIYVLRGETYFTPAQILALARADKLSPFDDQRAEQVHGLTTGNPLLVELAFEMLRRGNSVAELTQEDLIAARVERVVSTLKQADAALVRPSALAALALGTLAGPGCTLMLAKGHFPASELDARVLRSGFPVEAMTIDLSSELPMIKPEMIGDAFVRYIVCEHAGHIADEVRDALFSISPERWLRAVERLGRGIDATADAFCSAPKGFGEAAPPLQEAAFKAWLALGHFGWRDAVDMARRVDGLIKAFPTAETRHAMGERLLHWHMKQIEADWEARCRSGAQWRAALTAGKTCSEAVAEQERQATRPLENRYLRGDAIAAFGLMLAAHRFETSPDTPCSLQGVKARMNFAQALIEASRVDDGDIAEALVPWADGIFACLANIPSTDVTSVFSEVRRERDWPVSSGTAAKLALWGALCRQSPNFTCVGEIAFAWAGRLRSRLESDPALCRSAQEQVEAIASQSAYADDRDMQLERVRSWRHLAFALIVDPALCRAAQERVEAITSRRSYEDDREMQVERASTLRFLVAAEQADPVRCREAQERVEAITGRRRYADDRVMQFDRADALRLLASAERADSVGCVKAQKQVEAITGRRRYADDRKLQHARAQALQQLAFASTFDAVQCRSLRDQIDAITRQPRYALDRDMQIERARALRHLAFAERADPARCREAQELVEAITSKPRYANDRAMQYERAHAWQHLALAEQADPARCREAQERVEAITSEPRYANARDMQYARAQAWQILASATRNEIIAWHQAKSALERICQPWLGDSAFTDELDKARSFHPGT